MKSITIEVEDDKEAKRLVKSLDMACCLFEIKNNMWRQWEHQDKNLNYHEVNEAISKIFEENNIDINDLID